MTAVLNRSSLAGMAVRPPLSMAICICVMLLAAGSGCLQSPPPTRDAGKSGRAPIAQGTLEKVTVWNKPVQSPGETGSNSGSTYGPGGTVEIYDEFIIVTPESGPSVLSLHGWYTNLSFERTDIARPKKAAGTP